MSTFDDFKFESLREDDREAVCGWLREHLLEHMRWWSTEIGPAWSDAHILEHLREHQLVEREWSELWEDARKEDRFVTVARDLDGKALGVVWGSVRIDRYFRHPRGELNWICVEPQERRRGIAALLMDWADLWFKGREVRSYELFATGLNRSAIELYKKRGYTVVDVRMLRGAL